MTTPELVVAIVLAAAIVLIYGAIAALLYFERKAK